jgi:hypothetical protein
MFNGKFAQEIDHLFQTYNLASNEIQTDLAEIAGFGGQFPN